MLFKKKISRSCSYCKHSTKLDDSQFLCAKRGVVPADKSCRKFIYDPFKRVPPKTKASDFSQFENEDFSL